MLFFFFIGLFCLLLVIGFFVTAGKASLHFAIKALVVLVALVFVGFIGLIVWIILSSH